MSESDVQLRCPSELELEKYSSGTCTQAAQSSIAAHLTDCARCSAWLAEGRRDDDILARLRALSTATTEVTLDARAETSFLPEQIGEFAIISRIGEGGMGTVYEAQQQRPQRRVALKVLRAGLRSVSAPKRFEREAEILGRLQHPSIAQIYEAGTAETERGPVAYLTMELVSGTRLTDYCHDNKLDVRQRLQLLADVADAVSHAHSRGVIHRDLKPANILVDENGRPRILDFGVARITDADLQATLETNTGQLVGTLAYMSPEQVQGDTGAIDERTDVYALGVIAYELLTGQIPLGVGRMLIHEAARAIQEDDPTPLSLVNRVYRGDVETIVGKALAKEKERRYASAQAFAADIRRYLRAEPIVARPASKSYQLKKFAARNRALVAGVAATMVALAFGLAGSLWFAVSATQARADAEHEARRAIAAEAEAAEAAQQARAEADKAKRIQGFVTGMLESADPVNAGPEMTVRELLDGAATRVGDELQDDPFVLAAVEHTIAKSYDALNLFQEAEAHFRAELAILEEKLPTDDDQILAVRSELAAVLGELGRVDEALELLLPTLATLEARHGREDDLTMAAIHNLAWVRDYQGQSDVARELVEEELAYLEKTKGPNDAATLSVMNTLAILLQTSGDVAGAQPIMRQAFERARESLGENDPRTLVFLHGLAVIKYKLNERAACRALFDDLYPRAQEVYGPDHPRTQAAAQILGVLLLDEDPARAEAIFREILAFREVELGPTHLDTLRMYNNLGYAAKNQSRFVEATNHWRKAAEIGVREHRAHRETRKFVAALVAQLVEAEQYDEATDWMKTQVLLYEEKFGPQDQQTMDRRSYLAEIHLQAGRLTAAREIWEEMLAAVQALEIEEAPKTQAVQYILGRLDEVAAAEGGALRVTSDE